MSLRDLISAQFTDQVRLSLFLHITFIIYFSFYCLYLVVCLFTPICACVLLQWYTLNDVKSGRLHLVLEWVPKVSEPTRLEQVMCFYYICFNCSSEFNNINWFCDFCIQILHYNYRQSYLNKMVPSAALLFVYVERAHGLPVSFILFSFKYLNYFFTA